MTKEIIIYQNKNGKIVGLEDMSFGGIRYMLFNANGDYVKDLQEPFKVFDYL